MPDADIQAFQVREYDLDLVLSHFWPEGNFFTGNYSLPIEQFNGAVKTHRHTHDEQASTYGSPVLDSSRSLVGTNTESLVGAPDRTKYSAAWRTSRAFIMISIMQDQPSEVRGSRLLFVVGQTSK